MGLSEDKKLLLPKNFLSGNMKIPAALYLIGNRAWWLPSWLDRVLPNVKFAH